MTAAAGSQQQTGPRYCANHPKVETAVSCADCGKPICPDCMVQAAVGIKCRDCARMPRSARVTLKPRTAARSIAAALGAGTGLGLLLSFAGGFGFGFFTFVAAYFIGLLIGRAVLAASGRYRAESTAWIAVGGAVWAYVLPAIVIAVARDSTASVGIQGLGLLIAGFFAYREVVS